jgi:tetratricopeptide (TPR) repeat protein
MGELKRAADSAVERDAVPGTTIRFFLSSTFADFQVERDVLQRRVFPEMRRLCASYGFRLQPIDLRWGVSEAAGADRQTLRICFDELERCRALSPDFFLLIQLGERYGSYILPPQVSADLAARLLSHLTPEERATFAGVYRLDENAAPPEYALLRTEGPERAEDERLRRALARSGHAAGASQEELLLFEGSATHREIALGLLEPPPDARRAAGVLCAVRAFAGAPRGAAAEWFVERDAARAAAVQRLAQAVLSRVPSEQTLRYKVGWRNAGPAFDQDALALAYLGLLRPKVEAVIAARSAARAAAATRGRDAVALANAAFRAERATRVRGRATELARLAAYLGGETGAGQPLVVTGAAGSGKSTLLAEAVAHAAVALPNAARVVRYCGVTPGAETLAALLRDVQRAIGQAYGLPELDALTDENQLVSAMATQLATLPAPPEQPLLLVVDALDHLDAHAQRTDWLPPRLAPHVRVVISVLADRAELAALIARLPAEQVLTLAPLGWEAGRAMLHDLLAAAPQRTLTPAQEEAALTAFAAHGLPLHLRLLVGEARRWRSFDAPQLGASPLPDDTPLLLEAILQRLEAPERNGRILVARSLGALAAARFGLTEDELLDLLARDAAVREEQHTLAPSSPPIDPSLPAPLALWAGLHAQLAPLLTEREADAGVRLSTFYHRQLRAAVETRYLAGGEGAERYMALATYFAGQPWRLGPGQWNWRKARELVTQQERAGNRAGAERALSKLADELERTSASQTGEPGRVVALIDVLRGHLYRGGYRRVGVRLYKRQLAAQRARADRAGEGRALNLLGALTAALDRPEEASRYLKAALVIARELGDRSGEGSILGGLGTVSEQQWRFDEAERLCAQALTIAHETGNRSGEGTALVNLGALAHRRRRYEEAQRFYEQGLAIRRDVGDRAGEGSTLTNLGLLAATIGRAEDAERYVERALTLAREVGDRAGEATALRELGRLARARGNKKEAKRYDKQALAIFDEIGAAHAALNVRVSRRPFGFVTIFDV